MSDPERDGSADAPGTATRRKVIRLAAAGGLVGGAAMLGYRSLDRATTTSPAAVVGRPAPALSGSDLEGRSQDLADRRGQVVLVNVWASWCAPCRDEYPVLRDAADGLGPRGLAVLGINTQDSDEDARRFLDELGGEAYPSITDPDGRIAVEWGTAGVPESFVIDRDGTVRVRLVGEVTGAWIASDVLPLLGD